MLCFVWGRQTFIVLPFSVIGQTTGSVKKMYLCKSHPPNPTQPFDPRSLQHLDMRWHCKHHVLKEVCGISMELNMARPKKTVQGQRGPKRGFPTLRCDAPGGGWRCDAATLRRSGGRVALRRCDAATLRRCDAAVGPVTLRRCWRCDAATLRRWSDAAVGPVTLRRCDAATRERRCRWASDAATLRRCVAGATLRRCWRCDAATRERRWDAVDAATLLALRRLRLRERTRERRCDAVARLRKLPLKIVNECTRFYA